MRDIWILPLDGPGGAPGKPIPFLTTRDNESEPRLSPDGKWIAFVSSATGNARAYIRAFPGGPRGQWPVSVGAATNLSWHTSGNELYYRGPSPAGTGGVFAAAVKALSDRVEIGAAQELYKSVLGGTGGGLSSDGERFLAFSRPGDLVEQSRTRNPLTVVVNWQAALE